MRAGRVALILPAEYESDPEATRAALEEMIGPAFELTDELVTWIRRDSYGEVLHVESAVIKR